MSHILDVLEATHLDTELAHKNLLARGYTHVKQGNTDVYSHPSGDRYYHSAGDTHYHYRPHSQSAFGRERLRLLFKLS
jgi:hypothetical protein